MIMQSKAAATMTLDGVEVTFGPGETLYEVAQRNDTDIPSLCYDPRLEPFGGCRLCVVELEGARNPVASCTTKAAAGMVVHTRTDALDGHRRTLLEMVASENRELRRANEILKRASAFFAAGLDRPHT